MTSGFRFALCSQLFIPLPCNSTSSYTSYPSPAPRTPSESFITGSLEHSLLSMSPALLRFWQHGLSSAISLAPAVPGLCVVLLVELTADSLLGGQGGIRDVVA